MLKDETSYQKQDKKIPKYDRCRKEVKKVIETADTKK
jgi:hypothetical protein